MRTLMYDDGSQWEVSEVDGFGVGPARQTNEAALIFKSAGAWLSEPTTPGTLGQLSGNDLLAHLKHALADSGMPRYPLLLWFDADESVELETARAGLSSAAVEVRGPAGMSGPLVPMALSVAGPTAPAGLICTTAPDRVVAYTRNRARCRPVRQVGGAWEWDRT